jgi:hypothetical protein
MAAAVIRANTSQSVIEPLPDKPLELHPEKTIQGRKNVGITTYVITAVLLNASHPNPLIHIKALDIYMAKYPANLKRSRGL